MKIYEIEDYMTPGMKVDISYEDRYINLIKTDCSESLSAMQGTGFLYRGLDFPDGTDNLKAFKGRSRTNRKSLSNIDDIQQLFDRAMKMYGFTANRSNSIFCSGDFYQATSYGTVYLIFPVDGFSYLWSNKIRDLLGMSTYVKQTLENALESMDTEDAVANAVRTLAISDSDLSNALTSRHEILINGYYYAFNRKLFSNLFSTTFSIPNSNKPTTARAY